MFAMHRSGPVGCRVPGGRRRPVVVWHEPASAAGGRRGGFSVAPGRHMPSVGNGRRPRGGGRRVLTAAEQRTHKYKCINDDAL